MDAQRRFFLFDQGIDARKARKWLEAIDSFRLAIAANADHADAHYYLGLTLDEQGMKAEAITAYQRAIALAPAMAAAHSNMGGSLNGLERFDEAIAACNMAIEIQPDVYQAHYNLANALHSTARMEAAAASYRRVLQLAPGNLSAASSYLFTLHFDPRWDAAGLLREHAVWNRYYAEPFRKQIVPHDNDRSTGRRLRVGYVSSDLSSNVLGFSLLPLLSRHDHSRFEIFCYSSGSESDAVTEKIRGYADAWRDISGANDDDAAALIRADKIDILVDLGLHTYQNRLLVFARKPAPVQVTYLGYCSTTGLPTIDWRISDSHLDPDGTDLNSYSEQTVRLPASYWCYQPLKSPPVGPAPKLANRHVTFGCLNNFRKISPPGIELWAEILAGLPRSRLILHCPAGSHRQELLDRFSSRGVTADRIELLTDQNWGDYIQTFHRIDVALDPFPYGGGISTFNALWMGVPVVTLSGRTAVGRGGRSILSNIGMPELIAYSPEDYLRIAADAEQWIGHRATLRERMMASPVMDAARLARDVEAAYRAMWMKWANG